MSKQVIERLVAVLAAVVSGVVVAMLAAVTLGTPAVAAPAVAAPAQEQTYGAVLVSVSGPKTGAFTSTAASMRSHTLLQYGGALSLASGQTVTAKIQTSFDNATWYDYVVVHNAVAAATTVTPVQTNAVGLWVRMIYVPVTTTLTYTPVFWLVGK